MKWSSLKTIMLGLLIAMNVFMLGVTVVKRCKSEKIPPLVLAAAVETMENNSVTCPSELLPEKYMTMPRLRAEFPTAAELSRRFFGEQLAFQTDNRTLIARKDGAELKVEDASVSYSSGKKTVSASQRKLRRALKALGFDMSLARYDNGTFYARYDGIEIFDMYIRASLDEDGNVARLEACWPDVHASGEIETGVSIVNCLPQICDTFSGATVKTVENGYSLVVAGTQSAFVPSWRVTAEDGRSEIVGGGAVGR